MQLVDWGSPQDQQNDTIQGQTAGAEWEIWALISTLGQWPFSTDKFGPVAVRAAMANAAPLTHRRTLGMQHRE